MHAKFLIILNSPRVKLMDYGFRVLYYCYTSTFHIILCFDRNFILIAVFAVKQMQLLNNNNILLRNTN